MPLRVERPVDGVVRLTLDRPEKRNALSLELRDELADALEAAAGDEAVRCVVLTGAGSAFCAGMDVTQFGGDRANKERIVETSTRLFDRLARLPLPIVAAVNGPAVAGGFALALLCDVRVAAPGATFGFPEIGRFIPPSYGAAMAALPEPLARRLCLTGELLDADRALTLGVVSEVHENVGEACVELASGIAAAPGHVTREVKRRILLGGERTWLPLLADEAEQLRKALLDL
jgi:enoyl-CoA hydratase/carnithine racemase